MTAPPAGRTAAGHKLQFLLAYAEARGVPAAELRARFALDAAPPDALEGRVPLALVVRLWEELPGLLGDPDMPLAVLSAAEAADPPLPVLLFLAAPTLGEALRRMIRYERLGFDVADAPVSRLEVRGGRAHVTYDAARCEVMPPAGAVAQTLGAVLALARRGTRRELVPHAVSLRYPRPPALGRWHAVFGPNLRFDAPEDRLTLDAAALDWPHPDRSPTLDLLARRHADAAVAGLPLGGDWVARVRSAVRARLGAGPVAWEDLEVPGASVRTLQRRLEEAGTSLRRVVDDERRAHALRLLADANTPLSEVARRAGFADQSSFTRAFTRWTAHTPAAWRRGAPGP